MGLFRGCLAASRWDDDAAESLRKGGRGRGRPARVTAAARGLPARLLPVYLGRSKIVSMFVRTLVKHANFFWLRSKQLE